MKFLLSGISKELQTRKITLADEIYIKENHPNYFEKLNGEPDLAMICDILYHLLIDKSPFQAEIIEDYDKQGNKAPRAFGGVEKMMRACLTDADKLTIVQVFVDACNKSRPDSDNSVKKKTKKLHSLITGALFTMLLVFTIGVLAKYWL